MFDLCIYRSSFNHALADVRSTYAWIKCLYYRLSVVTKWPSTGFYLNLHLSDGPRLMHCCCCMRSEKNHYPCASAGLEQRYISSLGVGSGEVCIYSRHYFGMCFIYGEIHYCHSMMSLRRPFYYSSRPYFCTTFPNHGT